MYVYVKLIQFVVQQKVTQHYKSTILQLKKNFLNKENDQNCVINTLKLGDERKKRL